MATMGNVFLRLFRGFAALHVARCLFSAAARVAVQQASQPAVLSVLPCAGLDA